jgi:hypothetical protein
MTAHQSPFQALRLYQKKHALGVWMRPAAGTGPDEQHLFYLKYNGIDLKRFICHSVRGLSA